MGLNKNDLKTLSCELLNPEVSVKKKYKTLKFLYREDLTIPQLHKSRLGKAVKKCTKIGGKVSDIAQKIISKWEILIHEYTTERNKYAEASAFQDGDDTNIDEPHVKCPVNSVEKRIKSKNKDDLSPFLSEKSFPKEAKLDEQSPIINPVKIIPKMNKNECKNDDDLFQHFLNENMIPRRTKRRSEIIHNNDDKKRPKSETEGASISQLKLDVDNQPQSNFNSLEEKFDPFKILSRTDLFNVPKTEFLETDSTVDVDVTSKYTSERKVWVPKTKNNTVNVPERHMESECIAGVSISEITTYNAKQLMEFELNNPEIRNETDIFWQKLFNKNYKCASRFDDEEWRDAYRRIETEEEAKLKKISERLNKKTEISKKNESRAKIINEPLKTARRFSGFRR